METRHDELVREMIKRGYNHNSPYSLPDLSHLPDEERYAKVDTTVSEQELKHRCANCYKGV